MKFFRSLSWGMQLLVLFLLFTILFYGAVVLMSALLPSLTGYKIEAIQNIDQNSPAGLVNASIIVQGVLSIFIFLVCGLVFAVLFSAKPLQYLGLQLPKNKINILLSIMLMLGAMPALQLIEGLFSTINFGTYFQNMQQSGDDMRNAFLKIPTLADFIKIFFIMAIIPGIGEEVFFRGILFKMAASKSSNKTIPILFSAIVFSLMHFNIYGFVSIFIAGILLALIYTLTGSLWCSILAHISFNGLQIVLTYVGKDNVAIKSFLNDTSVMHLLPYAFAGIALFLVSLYFLLKYKSLLDNWGRAYKKDIVFSFDKVEE